MKRTSLTLAILALSFALAVPAANASDGTISWVYMYKAESGRTSDLVDLISTHFGPEIERQIAEGNVTGWGIGEVVSTQGGYTHIEWLNFPNWSAAAAAEVAFEADYEALAKAHKDSMRRGFEEMLEQRSRVRLAQAVVREIRSEGNAPKYLFMGEWVARPGMESRLTELYKDVAEPRYRGLLTDGSISAFGMATPVLHDGDWTHWSWYTGDDIAALGAVAGALPGSQELDETLAELTEPGRHRDTIYRVVHLLGPSE